MNQQPTKTEFFFSLLAGVYGASKIKTTWPTLMDLQVAQRLWADHIEKHTEEELTGAIKNAQKMITNGEEGWDWPDIGLILSGAKRYGSALHREHPALSAPEETEEERAARIQLGRSRLSQIRDMLG